MLYFPWPRLLVLLLAISGASLAVAGQTYRYQDDQGVTHIGYLVPPEFIENGYEVLNEQGRVVDVVLPRSARDARAAKLLEEAEARHQRELQAAKDEALLRYYSAPEDVERVRDRKLEEFDTFIEIQKANIVNHGKRLTELQRQAAEIELGGKSVSPKLLKAIEALEHKIEDAKKAVKLKKAEKERLWQAFQQDIERLKALTGEQAAR